MKYRDDIITPTEFMNTVEDLLINRHVKGTELDGIKSVMLLSELLGMAIAMAADGDLNKLDVTHLMAESRSFEAAVKYANVIKD